jgi:hypothetical protein
LKLYEDYVGRELPLLVIDARERPAGKSDYPFEFATAAAELAKLQQDLEEKSGTSNRQLTSLLGYMHAVMQQVHKAKQDGRSELKKQPSHRLSAIDVDGDGELSLEEIQQYADMMKEPENEKKKVNAPWIWKVLKRMETELHVEGKDEKSAKESQAMEAGE